MIMMSLNLREIYFKKNDNDKFEFKGDIFNVQ